MFSSPCMIVDAFADDAFQGNAAAIVLDARGLDDRAMQKIASEFNLSETTFVLPSNIAHDEAAQTAIRFRWFTPVAEVDMCGHATIAGIHALAQTGRLTEAHDGSCTVRIETRSGILRGWVESLPNAGGSRMIWLNLPRPSFDACDLDRERLGRILGLGPDQFDPDVSPVRTQDQDLILFVDGFVTLNGMRPDFAFLGDYLRAVRMRGLCVATCKTITPSIHVQSRFFAPHYGINEDPVTGSVHGPLSAYLAHLRLLPQDGGWAAAVCLQGIPGGRSGRLSSLVQCGDPCLGVRIGGKAVTVMAGQLSF